MKNIQLKSSKIPAVLPIAVHPQRNQLDYQRLQMLLYSLRKKEAYKWLEQLYLVTPDNQKQSLAKHCKNVDFIKINILGEEELFPEFKQYINKHYYNYRKQMLIKIGIAKIIETEFFLTLDSDIICLQEITSESLIVDGKALMDYEEKSLHHAWWESSAEVLSTPVETNIPGISVTPSILSRTICEYLIEEVENKYQENWILTLMGMERIEKAKFWTEYSLYFLCAQKKNCLTKYHLDNLDDKNIPLIDHNYSVWFASEIEKMKNLEQLPPPSGLFAVLQGASGISLETILNHLPTMLKIDSEDEQLLELRQDILH
ncbi:DUF6492 family protein [Calothrix sp. CCY 0018]|uniref:DUF6492 family protein n=1 Tax=Calothrix sp. CCY 0018 TaxID=3103864 RepID=UPI0039C65504